MVFLLEPHNLELSRVKYFKYSDKETFPNKPRVFFPGDQILRRLQQNLKASPTPTCQKQAAEETTAVSSFKRCQHTTKSAEWDPGTGTLNGH